MALYKITNLKTFLLYYPYDKAFLSELKHYMKIKNTTANVLMLKEFGIYSFSFSIISESINFGIKFSNIGMMIWLKLR